MKPSLYLLAFIAACDAPEIASHQRSVVPPPGARIVTTEQEFADALNDRTFSGTVFVPSGVTLNFTQGEQFKLYEGVTLMGGRSGTDEGAELQSTDRSHGYTFLTVVGNNVAVRGLRIHGPSTSWDSTLPRVTGISIHTDQWRNLAIEDNELWGWPAQAVEVRGTIDATTPDGVTPQMSRADAWQVRVRRNYIHDNLRDGLGYGVVVDSGAYAEITANVFENNRHSIACNGAPYTGYLAYYNYILDAGHCAGGTPCYYNQHFDVHGRGDGGYGGIAGEYFDVGHNTFRGDQTYYWGIETRPALMVRGTPTMGVYFDNNVTLHDSEDAAVRVKITSSGFSLGASAVPNIFVGPNQYGTDTSNDLAVGDFDGDGKADVFLANGTAWFYSSAGQAQWHFLRASSMRLADLAFGDFDGDHRTDVYYKSGYDGYFVPGGSGTPVRLASSAHSFSEYRFGDFDGDGKTDIFIANGSNWFVSWAARSSWTAINASAYQVGDLRFGDFDGDGRTDVFSFASGQWSWSSGGQAGWAKLNDELSSDLSSLVFGDFDGDGKTDIAQRSGDVWRFSQGGRTAWRQLWDGSQSDYRDLRSALIGDFDGNGRDDALRYGGARFYLWTRGGSFQPRSLHNMR